MMDASFEILIIDDEPILRQQLQQLLAEWGYRSRSAPDAETALTALRRSLPDIIITDMVLPGLSGMAVLQYVRQHRPTLPVLLVTGYASLDSAIDALKQGAYDYLLKPITAPELRAALDRARTSVELERARTRAQQMRHIAEVALTLAHEINNPLAVLMGELQLRIEGNPQHPDEIRSLTVCLESAQRIAATIRRLMELQEVTYEQYGHLRLLNLGSEDPTGDLPHEG
jgi:DNA-binding response OmpR family regulator